MAVRSGFRFIAEGAATLAVSRAYVAIAKSELQRLKPLGLAMSYVVAKATTHKEFGTTAETPQPPQSHMRETVHSNRLLLSFGLLGHGLGGCF
jgi:hypothetical protein